MIDSHCHLNFIDKHGTPRQLAAQAAEAGVHTIVNIGADLESSKVSVELARQIPSVYATVGVHPHDARTVDDNVLAELKRLAADRKVVAIGEIGLDYYRDLSPRDVQRRAFCRQLDLAVELSKPVVIHTREAFADTIRIMKDYQGKLVGVFHCFPGDISEAHQVIDAGFLIAVGGVITYKNAGMAEVARLAPMESILLETDAPYLTPVPFRGQTNRPEYVKYVYEKLAVLKGIDFKTVEKVVDRNCQKLFRLVETMEG